MYPKNKDRPTCNNNKRKIDVCQPEIRLFVPILLL